MPPAPIMSLETASRWGLLPVAMVIAIGLILRLGAVTAPATGERGRDALLRGGVLALAATVVCVRVLGAIGHLHGTVLFGLLVVGTAALFVFPSRLRKRYAQVDWRRLFSVETVTIILVASASLAVTATAAYYLPIWQWDALGYHLPYVNFILQHGSFADIPRDVHYISTYPHVIEQFFAAWRAMLPDDRLVDAAQLPLGLLGAAAISVLGRQLGARQDHAFAAGLLWLTLPAVFMQLPTNYIDVGTTALLLAAVAFILAEPTRQNVIAAAISLGLLVGAKPNAPMAAALLFAVLCIRGFRAGRRGSLGLAAACIVLLGAEPYVVNMVRHGNPIWPVSVSLGPLELPGPLPVSSLLGSGCRTPRLEGFLPLRMVRSWIAFDALPAFDMRAGGFGFVFLMALPLAAFAAWRKRSLALAVVAITMLASPDPAVPRYVLGFPGLVFALAAAGLGELGTGRLARIAQLAKPRWRRILLWAIPATLAGFSLAHAYPGLAGEGPPLTAYPHLGERERLRAVGADGSPTAFYDALERLQPGDITAFDDALELRYLAWPPDLSTRAVWVETDRPDVDEVLHNPRIRLLMVEDGSTLATAATATGQFTEIFHCKPRPSLKCPDFPNASGPNGALAQALEKRPCVLLFRR